VIDDVIFFSVQLGVIRYDIMMHYSESPYIQVARLERQLDEEIQAKKTAEVNALSTSIITTTHITHSNRIKSVFTLNVDLLGHA
jgi:hypothetical protein